MDKLKRKLSLLNIPVYEIKNDDDLIEIISHHLLLSGNRVSDKNVKICFDMNSYSYDGSAEYLNVIVFQAFLAVEESSILFVDRTVKDNLQLINIAHYSVLVVKERDIVNSIEVALHRISSGSDYYSDYVDIISPDAIPVNSIVIIKRE